FLRRESEPVCPYGFSDVVECLLSKVLEGARDLASYMVVHPAGNDDSTRLGELLKTSRDVDPVTVDRRPIDDNFAEVYADTEPHSLVLGQLGVVLSYLLLHFDRARYGRRGSVELDDQAIAGLAD